MDDKSPPHSVRRAFLRHAPRKRECGSWKRGNGGDNYFCQNAGALLAIPDNGGHISHGGDDAHGVSHGPALPEADGSVGDVSNRHEGVPSAGDQGIQTQLPFLFSNIHTEMPRKANRDRVWLDQAK